MATYQSLKRITVMARPFIVGVIVAILLVNSIANASSLLTNKLIKLSGPEIEVVVDPINKEVRINRFALDKDLPTGKLLHRLSRPYVVKLKSMPVINSDGITKFNASDWYDGIGLKLEIKLLISNSGRSHGTVNITSQHEETTLSYSAQQLEVQNGQ